MRIHNAIQYEWVFFVIITAEGTISFEMFHHYDYRARLPHISSIPRVLFIVIKRDGLEQCFKVDILIHAQPRTVHRRHYILYTKKKNTC